MNRKQARYRSLSKSLSHRKHAAYMKSKYYQEQDDCCRLSTGYFYQMNASIDTSKPKYQWGLSYGNWPRRMR